MNFYPYVDPFNTPLYAEYMDRQGVKSAKCEKTYVYRKGRVSQVFYPMNEVQPQSAVTEFRAAVDYPKGISLEDWTNTVHVSLDGTLQDVLGRIAKDNRWGIRKAEERGVTAEITNDMDMFPLFVKIYKDAAKRNKIHSPPYKSLKSLYEMGPKICRLALTRVDNEVSSAYIMLVSEDVVRFYYGSFMPQYGRFHVNEYAHWKIIEMAKQLGCKVYDMGGVGQNPQEGEFKLGWGELVRLNYYTLGDALSKFMIMAYRRTSLFVSSLRNQL